MILLAVFAVGGAPEAPALPTTLRDAEVALESLRYEEALELATSIADDLDAEAAVRARALMVVAEARFGMAEPDAEPRARRALASALSMDPEVGFAHPRDVSPRLMSIFTDVRREVTSRPTPSSPTRDTSSPAAGHKAPARDAVRTRLPFVIAGCVVGGLGATGLATALGVAVVLEGKIPPTWSAADVAQAQQVGTASLVLGAVGVAVGSAVVAAQLLSNPP